MNKTMTILVDQDGVLANYSKKLIEVAAYEYPDEPEITEEKLIFFDTHLHFSRARQDDIEKIALRRGFFESLEPVAGAVEALQDLLSSGYDVRICTAPKKRFEHCVTEKLSWIEKHLGREFMLRTIITRDKTLVRGNVLIDDKPVVAGVADPEWEHILFDQPYNRNIPEKRRLTWQNYREILGLS